MYFLKQKFTWDISNVKHIILFEKKFNLYYKNMYD